MFLCCWQVQQLESRLRELEEDRKELARFQQVDRQRRSLEYTIYDKEVADTAAKLEQVIFLRAEALIVDRSTCEAYRCVLVHAISDPDTPARPSLAIW